MNTPRRRFLLTLWFFLWAWAAGEAAAPPALKVLFIGNSYTYVNDLPAIVVALADAAGGRKIEAGRSLAGGYTFEQHVKNGKAIEKIRAKRWDVVVLQEQSLQALIARDSTEKYARILNAAIKKQGAKTVFFLTWVRQNIPEMQAGADPAKSPAYAKAVYHVLEEPRPADFENWLRQHARGLAGGLNGAYFDLAGELGAEVAPVGLAWQKALETQPPPTLHQSDKSHPTPTGSYLAACVFFATLLDKSPVGLPAELKKGNSVLVQLAPDKAKRLQQIAWQTVQEAKRR